MTDYDNTPKPTDPFDDAEIVAWAAFVFPIAMKMLKHCVDDANEVCQKVIVQILTNATRIRGAASPEAYVYGIVRNEVSALRRQRSAPGPKPVRGLGQVEDQDQAGRTPRKKVINFGHPVAGGDECDEQKISFDELKPHNYIGSGSPPVAPDEWAMAREEAEACRADVSKAMAKLPKHYRDALTCIAIERRSYADAASYLQIPEGTLKSHVSRAKKKLAAMLGGRWAR